MKILDCLLKTHASLGAKKQFALLIDWLIIHAMAHNLWRIWKAMALHWSQFKDCISAGPQWFSNLSRGSKGLLGAFCEGAVRDRKIDKAHIEQFIHATLYNQGLAEQFIFGHAFARAFAEGEEVIAQFFRAGPALCKGRAPPRPSGIPCPWAADEQLRLQA